MRRRRVGHWRAHPEGLPGATFPAVPLRFRTWGFPPYGSKHQAPLSSARSLPPIPAGLSGPTHAPPRTAVYSGLRYLTTENGESRHRVREPPEIRHHLGPGVLAQHGLCCPAPPRLIDPIRRSGGLRFTSREQPVIETVLGVQGHPAWLARPFRTFAADLSRIAAFSLRRRAQCVPAPDSSALALTIR